MGTSVAFIAKILAHGARALISVVATSAWSGLFAGAKFPTYPISFFPSRLAVLTARHQTGGSAAQWLGRVP